MFGKLLKYDLRSMWKQFAFIWPTALIIALGNRFLLQARHPYEPGGTLGNRAANLMQLVFICILVAMFVLTVTYIIQRFYKGLLGGEGYLMHTLPVKPWQLIGSKFLCAMLTMTISLLVAAAATVILLPENAFGFIASISALWEELRQYLQVNDVNLLLSLAAWLAAAVSGLVQSILLLYLAIALGHLVIKYRVAASVVAYVLLNSLVSRLSLTLQLGSESFIAGPLSLTLPDLAPSGYYDGLLIEVVFSLLFFFATNYILKSKLNLE